MRELERESAHPTGIRTARTLPGTLDGVWVSEDCALLVKLDHGVALKYVLLPLDYSATD